MLSAELLYLDDDIMILDFFRRYFEQSLSVYSLKGEEKVQKGGIAILEDGSGSMSGRNEIWAKAIGLALLKIAMLQKRPFYAIHFGGTNEYTTFDYDTSGQTLKVTVQHRNTKPVEYSGIEAVMAYAELFFGGGTEFSGPMGKVMDKFQEDFETKGAVDADVVFLTDGMCGVSDDFMKKFKKEQARLGVRFFGINIGGSVTDQPLAEICDNRVIVPANLQDASDVRSLFGVI